MCARGPLNIPSISIDDVVAPSSIIRAGANRLEGYEQVIYELGQIRNVISAVMVDIGLIPTTERLLGDKHMIYQYRKIGYVNIVGRIAVDIPRSPPHSTSYCREYRISAALCADNALLTGLLYCSGRPSLYRL